MQPQNFSRLRAAATLLTFAAMPLANAQAQAPAAQPNVLLIISDDLRPTLGCYGDTLAQTPNIDRLSREGVRFERAYCQQAVCAPSRASFLSGLRPTTLNIFDLETPLRKSNPDVVTLPQTFKNAGYQTISLGKVYHHNNDDKENWTHKPAEAGQEYASQATLDSMERKRDEARASGLKGIKAWQAAHGPAVEAADVPDEVYRDGAIANQAIGLMRELKGESWMMAVGFRLPHLPFAAPQKYWDLYRREQFKVPVAQKPVGMPDFALWDFGELRAYSDIPSRQEAPVLSDEKSRELIHGYYASVSYMDAQVGKLLDEVDASKRDTVVVFMSDHGYKLGEYGSWCKHSNMEIDTRAPLIVRAPFEKSLRAGAASSALVEYIDVFPTIADLCGLKAPDALEGRSVRPLLSQPEQPWKTAAISVYPRGDIMGYSLRSGPWRYIEWQRGDKVVERELYDHSDSSVAIANLAGEPKYAATVQELSALLNADAKGKAPQ